MEQEESFLPSVCTEGEDEHLARFVLGGRHFYFRTWCVLLLFGASGGKSDFVLLSPVGDPATLKFTSRMGARCGKGTVGGGQGNTPD